MFPFLNNFLFLSSYETIILLNTLGWHWFTKPDFKCITQQNIICPLHHGPIAHSKISFHPHLSPLCPPLPNLPTLSLWLSPLCFLCLWVMHIRSLTNPFTIFYPVPQPPPTPKAVSLFHVSMSVSILFISLFSSSDSKYKWDHMVFVFLWMAYFT